MPALEALVAQFERDCNTQLVGISVDSRYCHGNWGADLGGVSYPLLGDFHPKGQVARSYGVYREEKGIIDRATILIDRAGIVRHASSVGPSDQRNANELLALAKQTGTPAERDAHLPPRGALAADATLYVQKGCIFCRSVLRARKNLHCDSAVRVRDVTTEPAARHDLDALAGPSAKVPVLVENGKVLRDSDRIIKYLAQLYGHALYPPPSPG